MPLMCSDVTCLINVNYIKSNKMQGKHLLNIVNIWKKITYEKVEISKRLYFTCENIEYNLITLTFTVDFPQPTSDFQTYKWSKAQTVGINLLNWIIRGLLVHCQYMLTFYTFLTQATRAVVSDLEDHTVLHYSQALVATQKLCKYNIKLYVTKNNIGKPQVHISIINLH